MRVASASLWSAPSPHRARRGRTRRHSQLVPLELEWPHPRVPQLLMSPLARMPGLYRPQEVSPRPPGGGGRGAAARLVTSAGGGVRTSQIPARRSGSSAPRPRLLQVRGKEARRSRHAPSRLLAEHLHATCRGRLQQVGVGGSTGTEAGPAVASRELRPRTLWVRAEALLESLPHIRWWRSNRRWQSRSSRPSANVVHRLARCIHAREQEDRASVIHACVQRSRSARHAGRRLLVGSGSRGRATSARREAREGP
jgi:hypothetical protein